MRPRSLALAGVALVLTLLVVPTADSPVARPPAGRVTVLASWTGAEERQFGTVLREFTARTGIQVDYQGTRDVEQVLAGDMLKGTLPDVAVLPSLRELADYAANGALVPLDERIVDRRQYPRQWQELQELGGTGRELYAVPVKADLKGLVWYSPSRGTKPPLSFSDVLGADPGSGARWCLGMGAPPASGWPGTDWIETLLLRRGGPEAYRDWVRGDLAWTSTPVRRAWQDWRQVLDAPSAVYGGASAALLTDFTDAGRPLFRPDGCAFEQQAAFIAGSYESYGKRPGRDFDFVRFPSLAEETLPRWTVASDVAGMFHGTPQARELMRFLSSAHGQRIWPTVSGGRAVSVNRMVRPDDHGVYPSHVSRRIARVLTSERTTLCFDASDLMSPTLREAFYRAVREFLADPDRLEALLADLDRIADEVPRQRLPVCGG